MPSRISLASLALGLAAVTGGIAVACLDAHTDEVSVTLAALIILGFVLGSVGPRRAWLWALLVSVWTPVLAFAGAAGLAPSNPSLPLTVPSFLALTVVTGAVALAGAYTGAWLGRAVRRATLKQSHDVL
ncbi:MAG TPA: hypothetical protein VI455_05960 [Terriglobia bacterium]